MSLGIFTNRTSLRSMLMLLLVCVLVTFFPPPADGQGSRRIVGGAVVRPNMHSQRRAATEAKRFRVRRSKLVVDRNHQLQAPLRLHSNAARDFVLSLHANGHARLWDIERGMQISGVAGGDGIVAGTVRGSGAGTEIVLVRRDGSSTVERLDGTPYPLAGAIRGFDADVAPVLSADGTTMGFRTIDGRWVMRTRTGELIALPDTAIDARPVLSPTGSMVVFRTTDGVSIVGRLERDGVRIMGSLEHCTRRMKFTAGAFAPRGDQVVLGDARRNLCSWDLTDGAQLRRRFKKKAGNGFGAVRTIAIAEDGRRAAVGSDRGRVEIWDISGRGKRTRSFALDDSDARSLLLDSRRNWVLNGQKGGIVGINSVKGKEAEQIARLVSTDTGWSVIDNRSRFDGPQNGIDALAWAGEMGKGSEAPVVLPVDAFSDGCFEPGLLAKLADTAKAHYVNLNGCDVEAEYIRPPEVEIVLPVADRRWVAGESVPVKVRKKEPEYPDKFVAEIRLYHNGKLVPEKERVDSGEYAARFHVRLSPGENRLRAIGVGPDGVESGTLSSVPVTLIHAEADTTDAKRENLHLVAVGINDYLRPHHPNWGNLTYARNDAATIATEFDQRGSKIFQDIRATTLLDAEATKPGIEHVLANSSSQHDVLVTYFSGHGYSMEGENGWEWYLLPYSDAWRDEPGTEATYREWIRRNSLSSRHLMSLLVEADAQRVVLILDSCRSGAMGLALDRTISSSGARSIEDAVTQRALRRIARVGGIHVLAAARADEDAVEMPESGLAASEHGALTYLVLEGIRGAADGVIARQDIDKRVTVREIIEYATLEMPNLSRRDGLDRYEPISQRPIGYSRGTDFELALL